MPSIPPFHSMDGQPTPPQTPTVFEFIAVPRDDAGVGHAASAAYTNLKWLSADKDQMAQQNWQAYQNLMQLAGMMSLVRLSNASRVWNEVVEFVETTDMAVSLDAEFAQGQKRSFQPDSKIAYAPSEPSKQSPAPVNTARFAEPCAGNTETTAQSVGGLTRQQLQEIAERREVAKAIKAAKQQEQDAAAASGAVGPAARATGEAAPRSIAYV